jgi:hypothetical protein
MESNLFKNKCSFLDPNLTTQRSNFFGLLNLTALACGHLQANCQPDTWRWSYDRTFTMELLHGARIQAVAATSTHEISNFNFNINGLLDERKHNLHSFFIQIKQFITWQCSPHVTSSKNTAPKCINTTNPSSHNTHNSTTSREWFALSSHQGWILPLGGSLTIESS